MLVAGAISLSLGIGACTRHTPPARAMNGFERLRLERSGCYGWCPAYAITLESRGQITFEGFHFVRERSGTAVVGPGRVNAVLDALETTKFRELREHYETTADGCEDVATDMETVTLSVTAAGHTKTVRHYLGCVELPPKTAAVAPRSAMPQPAPEWRPPPPPPESPRSWPRELVVLERELDELLGSERWSGGGVKSCPEPCQ